MPRPLKQQKNLKMGSAPPFSFPISAFPTIETLSKIAKALNATVDDLIK